MAIVQFYYHCYTFFDCFASFPFGVSSEPNRFFICLYSSELRNERYIYIKLISSLFKIAESAWSAFSPKKILNLIPGIKNDTCILFIISPEGKDIIGTGSVSLSMHTVI